jgi:hypothetical protein
MEAHVATFLDEVSRWPAGRPDVRAAVLLGSQARVDAPADPSCRGPRRGALSRLEALLAR